jgi:hypothetical protein
MTNSTVYAWYKLCELASRETDPERLLVLVQQINDALEKREREIRQLVDTAKVDKNLQSAK